MKSCPARLQAQKRKRSPLCDQLRPQDRNSERGTIPSAAGGGGGGRGSRCWRERALFTPGELRTIHTRRTPGRVQQCPGCTRSIPQRFRPSLSALHEPGLQSWTHTSTTNSPARSHEGVEPIHPATNESGQTAEGPLSETPPGEEVWPTATTPTDDLAKRMRGQTASGKKYNFTSLT